ncbi:DUF7146 domain-containing protein [Sphingobium sp. TKS]|uniref:Virulence-associated protein E n=1 Tax=Sphingobium chungbukense TaxID=56193 RepID=A0A0M3AI63_9SPHN|nr:MULTISPECIES: toprim domain-containing protein [Sphingobium]AMK26175.1 virulence-associated protein E [Sphingobium sp. TKS]KKW89540.1 virulence-associated protein E [Sphingobium chungbukense]
MPLITRRPSQDTIDLVGALDGSWHGRTAMCRCPVHDDRAPSLSIRQGDHGILVTCFAGCAREDVLRALRRIPRRKRFAYCDTPSRSSGSAARLWAQAGPVSGTLAERYMTLRGLEPPVADVRYHPRCPYRPLPWTSYQPALLLAVREGRQLTAVQRIFLDPQTGACRMKLLLGRPGGGAWQGGGRPDSVLALAEGFETARAFNLLEGEPCWASLGARRLDRLILPQSLSSLILAADNDGEGERAAARAMRRYARPGLEISIRTPKGVKDWAEALETVRSPQR